MILPRSPDPLERQEKQEAKLGYIILIIRHSLLFTPDSEEASMEATNVGKAQI